MKSIKEKFLALMAMLDKVSSKNEIVEECISQKLEELSFSSFDPDSKVRKKNIYDIYKTRSILLPHEVDQERFVIGYDKLLPNLERTPLNFVNVSSITTEKGTYIIFSDYEYKDFIGILKSKRTLSQVREMMKGSEYYKEVTLKNGLII